MRHMLEKQPIYVQGFECSPYNTSRRGLEQSVEQSQFNYGLRALSQRMRKRKDTKSGATSNR